MRKILFFLVALFSTGSVFAQSQDSISVRLAQQQLDAYNARDIEAFLLPYADTVRVYDYPGQLLYKGKDEMRRQYTPLFQQAKSLHCTLVNRIVLSNTVIDHESVVFDKNRPALKAIAIYTIAGDKIVEVRFIAPM